VKALDVVHAILATHSGQPNSRLIGEGRDKLKAAEDALIHLYDPAKAADFLWPESSDSIKILKL
jgi:hypothetical protein